MKYTRILRPAAALLVLATAHLFVLGQVSPLSTSVTKVPCGNIWLQTGCGDSYCFFPNPHFKQDIVGAWSCDQTNNISNFTCDAIDTEDCCFFSQTGYCRAQCPCPY